MASITLVRRCVYVALSIGSVACASPSAEEPKPPLAQQVVDDATSESDWNTGGALEADPLPPPARRDMDGSGCTLPPTCTDVRTSGVNINMCCTRRLACGVDLKPMVESLQSPESGVPPWLLREIVRLTLPAGTNLDQPCVPASGLWMPTPSLPDQRIRVGEEPEIILAQRCTSRALVAFPLYGCCMPSGQCGYSTHLASGDFKGFTPPGSPLRKVQCTTAAELNRQMQETTLRSIAALPEATGRCDYAGLSRRLPPPEEGWDVAED